MRFELHHPDADPSERPLVGDVEPSDATRPGRGDDRDAAIIELLRDKLLGRKALPKAAARPSPSAAADTEAEDKYEPQRISRKICWQYDQSARKIPLLRRHYI